jgi:hypothetical protein
MHAAIAISLILPTCIVDSGWARQRFETAFLRATSGIVGIEGVMFIQDSSLPFRAVTSWGEDSRWHIRYRPELLCPDPDTDIDIHGFVLQVAVHEACHVRLHGSRLKSPVPIGDAERITLEMSANRCATIIIASWTGKEGTK